LTYLSTPSSPDVGKGTAAYTNVRELAYERQAAMVASWPWVIRNSADIDALVKALPYLAVMLFRFTIQTPS
jgi:hypothetical protein